MDFSGRAKSQAQWGRQVRTGYQYYESPLCTQPIRIVINFESGDVQFAPVCSTEFDFLLNHWKLLHSRMHIGPHGWNCNINISCEDSNTIQLCCKFISNVVFWKIFQFQFIFGDLRALEFERVDGMFPTFSSYIYFALLVSPSTKNQAKANNFKHIMMTKYNKSRILRYFIIFICFKHKCKIPYVVVQVQYDFELVQFILIQCNISCFKLSWTGTNQFFFKPVYFSHNFYPSQTNN